jgi:arginyl-tRNA--protein-N-Asp/Glu arginylyltransferase
MKLVFSEALPDYTNYVFPYVVWAFPEDPESPKDCFAQGFLPSLPDLSRFYLCRQVRVRLEKFHPSSENRRVLRHGKGISVTVQAREDFAWTTERRGFCHRYATQRWSVPPSIERIERIFNSAATTHVASFCDLEGRLVGLVTLLGDGASWFYSNAFYDPSAQSGLGAFLMTEIVRTFSDQGQEFLYLGTCYSRSALYKTAFPGVEFFDGNRWLTDLKALKLILARQDSAPAGHLLESPEFLQAWVPEELGALARQSPATISVGQ